MRYEITELCEQHRWSDAVCFVLHTPSMPGQSRIGDLLLIGRDILDPRHGLKGSERDSLLVPIIATLLQHGSTENVRDFLGALSSDKLRASFSAATEALFFTRRFLADQGFVGS